MVTYEKYLELVQSRRSMRAFSDKEVTKEQIKKIITAASYAPLLTSTVKEEEVRILLKIPDYIDLFDAVAIGYPAYEPRKKYIKPVERAIHYGAYDKFKSMTDREIVERAKTREDYKFID